MVSSVASYTGTVLLVAPYRDEREMYAEYLRFDRFSILEVDNTADALALAPQADVVVTDIRVPGPFDGIELIRRFRRDRLTCRTPVIVVTACAFDAQRREATAAGCDAFLPKPCTPDTLADEIRNLLALAPRTGV